MEISVSRMMCLAHSAQVMALWRYNFCVLTCFFVVFLARAPLSVTVGM